MLSRQMHHMAMVRSVHHTVNDHNAGAYYMLTGRSPVKGGSLIVRDEPENFPPYGAVMAMKNPHGRIPEFVHLPDVMSNMGYDIPGQRAGFLGAAHNPLVAVRELDLTRGGRCLRHLTVTRTKPPPRTPIWARTTTKPSRCWPQTKPATHLS
jgi:hypothetical protein